MFMWRRSEVRRGEESQAVLKEATRNVYSSGADLDTAPFTAYINLIAEDRFLSLNSARATPADDLSSDGLSETLHRDKT